MLSTLAMSGLAEFHFAPGDDESATVPATGITADDGEIVNGGRRDSARVCAVSAILSTFD